MSRHLQLAGTSRACPPLPMLTGDRHKDTVCKMTQRSLLPICQGAVGGKLGGHLYVNLSDDNDFEAGVQHLVRDITALVKRKKAGSSNTNNSPSPHHGDGSGKESTSMKSPAASILGQISSDRSESMVATEVSKRKSDAATTILASVPSEVPELPDTMVDRSDFLNTLKARVLQLSKEAAKGGAKGEPKRPQNAHATALEGMGGVGKTIVAASLSRDAEVRSAFRRSASHRIRNIGGRQPHPRHWSQGVTWHPHVEPNGRPSDGRLRCGGAARALPSRVHPLPSLVPPLPSLVHPHAARAV